MAIKVRVEEPKSKKELIAESWERFTRLAWPLLQLPGIPRWNGETGPWATVRQGTKEEDSASIDGWFDDTIPFQERMQPTYNYRTMTLRRSEVRRLDEWATSPFGEEPAHPAIWIHGYGDPLFRLYVAPTRGVLLHRRDNEAEWGTNGDDGNLFVKLQASKFRRGMCALWEPDADGWRVR